MWPDRSSGATSPQEDLAMKLIIQIPCLNEAETLPTALAELPRKYLGSIPLNVLIVDDGSTDDTCDVAIKAGVDHVVRHTRNLGLARAFMTGLDAALSRGADIIVNTDADNQYNAADIPKLIEPILRGEAGNCRWRQAGLHDRPLFSTQKIPAIPRSAMVRRVSGTDIPDAPSGFRAISRSAALQLNVFSRIHLYTRDDYSGWP